jgi:uncharacterized protein YcbK (DUF882 family)
MKNKQAEERAREKKKNVDHHRQLLQQKREFFIISAFGHENKASSLRKRSREAQNKNGRRNLENYLSK